jgi:LacI family transcriptional regulator
MKKPVRIEDVAAAAGVSPMTVSRVMNNTARVRAETREAVLSAVERLEYRPNAAARNLARAGAGRIGMLYSNPSPGYLSAFLLGALEGAYQVGAQLLLEKCDLDADSERAALTRLAAGGVVGVILPPPHGESPSALAQIERLGLAVVAVAPGRFRSRVPSIRIDDFSAASEMTRRLIGLSHRRIGFIRGAANQTASAERLAGFETEISRAGGDAEAMIEAGEFTYRSGFDAAERLLKRPRRPTAIFASNDDMAAAAIAAAHRHGLDVPGDLSVVGFDDTPTASEIWPALTTVRQPVKEMAQRAVSLLSRAQGEGGADTVLADHLVQHRLIIRNSDGPPPKGS